MPTLKRLLSSILYSLSSILYPPSSIVLLALAIPQLALYGLVRAWGWVVPLDWFIVVFSIQFALYLAALALIHRQFLPLPTEERQPTLLTQAFRRYAPILPYLSELDDPAKASPHVNAPSQGLSLPSFVIILFAALAFRLVIFGAPPTLSTDAWRYVWDGRVQAAGYSPYDYPPSAPELTALRDTEVWPRINRKESVTIYPPAAQLLFWLIHALGGDSIWTVKAAMLLADSLTILLLALLLRDLGRPVELVILYAWHPLVVYEVIGNAHLEGLMLPCLVLALLAARRGWDITAGVAVAAASLMKLFPVLLLPALWWRRRWRMPLAFAFACLLLVLPYWESGLKILTYYPTYLREQFNMSLAAILGETLRLLGAPDPYRLVQLILFLGVAGLGLWHLWRPAEEPMLHRCLTMIGLLTVGSQFLHPWYILWLLPFLTALWPIDGVEREARGVKDVYRSTLHAPRATTWFAWLIFSGTIVLSYHFYIREVYNYPLVILEYLPLYVLLLWPWLPLRFPHPPPPSPTRGEGETHTPSPLMGEGDRG